MTLLLALFFSSLAANGSRNQKRDQAISLDPLKSVEAATGFEPVNNGFADRRLTTWLCRLGAGNGI